MSKKTIMVVDDIESNRMLLRMILEDDFEIIECDSGPACLTAVDNNVPDIILLDVNMPGMTGYEVCSKLRQHSKSATLPIIFVSAMDNVEERLEGFEVGGSEYVTKPIEPDILLEKINLHLAQQNEVNQTKENADTAMKVAMEAMTSGSELGQIIEFVKTAQHVTTLEGIGEKFREIAQSFGLTATAIIYGTPTLYINCTADSMEARILTKFQNSKENLVSIGVRTLIKSNSMGLLINDMPIEDEARYGRFKDHLMVLSNICEGYILTIKANLSASDQRQDLINDIIKMTEYQIEKLKVKLTEHDSNARDVIHAMITELETKLFSLGLDTDQEEQLMNLAYRASDNLEHLERDTDELAKELEKVLAGLYDV